MFFSIFTPTHDTTYLEQAFNSLRRQSCGDWQWVIVPNGNARIADAITRDPRVKVVAAPPRLNQFGVGALKRFACDHCDGKYLVELDHDDMLTPDALDKIKAAAETTDADFIYSDFTNFYENGTCQVYDAIYGWEKYDFKLDKRTYTAMRAFETDASSLSAIFYAPNHVRVWKRDAYIASGGHAADLAVCDDYELILRTYLLGAKFHYIPECLYLYRMHPEGAQTFLKRNQEIQDRQKQISNQHLHALVFEWAARSGLKMIDLAEDARAAAGFEPARRTADGALDYADGTVGCIKAFDVLGRVPACFGPECSHVPDAVTGLCTIGLMNEIYRVLAPGGWFLTRTPSSEGRGGTQDPLQRSLWNSNSFWYFTHRDYARRTPALPAQLPPSVDQAPPTKPDTLPSIRTMPVTPTAVSPPPEKPTPPVSEKFSPFSSHAGSDRAAFRASDSSRSKSLPATPCAPCAPCAPWAPWAP